MRTVVTFKSDAFNTSEERRYFINATCFGDDVAKWLMLRLREANIETDEEPGQEDFGWYFDFSVPEGKHCCVLGYRPGDENDGEWIVWLERSRGFLGSLLGQRNQGLARSAVTAIHAALSGSPVAAREVLGKLDLVIGILLALMLLPLVLGPIVGVYQLLQAGLYAGAAGLAALTAACYLVAGRAVVQGEFSPGTVFTVLAGAAITVFVFIRLRP